MRNLKYGLLGKTVYNIPGALYDQSCEFILLNLQFFLLAAFFTFSGCKSVKDSPKFKFGDGIYTSKVNGKKQSVYIENTNDSIVVYALEKGWQRLSLNASSIPKRTYPQKTSSKTIRTNQYKQNSFDIDILTIPLKFRPPISSFPGQLNNSLNGTVYLGYRNDTYSLSYDKNPIGILSQKITHYGISAGIITGIGTTAMNPYVTNNQISIEYDGLVWSKGVAIIMGVDKFTFGIIGALDHLADKNKTYWLYQGKPYVGLAVGLNLN